MAQNIFDGEQTNAHIEIPLLAEEYASRTKTKKAQLVSLLGSNKGTFITLRDDMDRLTLGRSAINDIVISDDTVSAFHAVLERKANGEHLLRDLGSTNGTFIAGERISEQEIGDGDQIFLGQKSLYKYELQDPIVQSMFTSLYEASFEDALTGVFNRRFLERKLGETISLCKRHTLHLGLVLFDLDHFKLVNDTHGHQTGDRLLACICRAISKQLRHEDFLARYGGEEFAVVAVGSDLAGIQILAERLKNTIAHTAVASVGDDPRAVQVTASLGCVSCFSSKEYATYEIFQEADTNLYRAKEAGRNMIVTTRFAP